MKSLSNQQFAFTSVYNRLSNKIFSSLVVTPPKDIPNIKFENKEIQAIWDTGATHTCISCKLANALQLTPISKRETKTANGNRVSDVYLIDLVLPNNVRVNNIQVTGVELLDEVDALIGMDIISNGDFAITNSEGRTVFSFRTPSVTKIDFVKKIENKNAEKRTQISKQNKKNKRKLANLSRKKNRKKNKRKK